MTEKTIHRCQCPNCQQEKGHLDQELHHQMNVFLSRLDEQQRRWYVALEAEKLGHGGVTRMAQITGLSADTIRRGREELERELVDRPSERVRVPGGGRPPVEKRARGRKRIRGIG